MSKLNFCWSAVPLLTLAMTTPVTSTAAPALTPGCDYRDAALYSGYGWISSQNESCEPIINAATGAAVELTRVVWDSNADLANRTIQCDLYTFDAAQQSYQLAADTGRTLSSASYQIEHLATSPVAPNSGWKTTRPTGGAELTYEYSQWSVTNDRYIGSENTSPSLFGFSMLDYPDLELLTNRNGVKVIRRWVDGIMWTGFGRDVNVSVANPGFYECRDLSGADLSPTGKSGVATSEPKSLSSLEFTVSENPNAGRPGEVFNLETGEAVDLIEARWNYNSDIAGQRISCITGLYNGTEYRREGSKFPTHPYHYSDSENQIYYRTNSDREEISPGLGSYNVANSVLQFTESAIAASADSFIYGYLVDPIFSSKYVELLDGGVRVWQNSAHFEECFGVSPSGSGSGSGGSCDYSNAASNGGWGWNATSRESCAPIDPPTRPGPTPGAAGCDYSNALQNGGWGWNAETQQSCAPQTTQSGSCDYSNATQNGGWGWNATTSESCPPL